MTVYTYDFIFSDHKLCSAPSWLFSGGFLFFFLHMELIRIVRLVNARIAQLESSFRMLVR